MSKRVISIQSEISISRSWDFWGLKPYVFSSYICLHIYKKSKKSNHRNSRFCTLKIVNRNKIRQSSWNDPPSFDYKNKAVINAYLTQYFRYCKFNSSSYRILPNPAWNLKKIPKIWIYLCAMQYFLSKILAKAMWKWRNLIGREIHVTAVQPPLV